MTLPRREFLGRCASAAGLALASTAMPSWARRACAAAAAPADLIERNDWPEHWETTITALGRSWITPNDRFFVRSHFPVPTIDASAWRLEVSGLVSKPLTLSLAELQAMPPTEATYTLECAGNGRALFDLPNTSGTQWERGAVGNAAWKGVRLGSLLERAGVSPEAHHVWFEAADHATLPEAPPFLRSIPLEKAMKDTLLAYAMNGEKLPARHGAPLRAIVPGWFGMASTKWVTRVRVESNPSDNHFMVKGYRYVTAGVDPAQAPPVDEMLVKSVITRPLAAQRLAAGTIRVQGWAWAGPSGVKLVEISLDQGKTWKAAGFMGDSAPMAWRGWATEIEQKTPGDLIMMARATDNAGHVQPLAAPANGGGYGNNGIHKVVAHVAA